MLLQSFEKPLTYHLPETPAPHTFTLTYRHNQALEIPHIPSTSLPALRPTGDNKGMGRN